MPKRTFIYYSNMKWKENCLKSKRAFFTATAHYSNGAVESVITSVTIPNQTNTVEIFWLLNQNTIKE